MDYSQISFQAMVVAAVVYLIAAMAHALEWSAAKNAVAAPPRKRRRIKVLVGAGADAATETELDDFSQHPASSDTDTATGGDRPAEPTNAEPTNAEPTNAELAGEHVVTETDKDRLRVDMFGRIGTAFTMVGFVIHLVAVVLRGVAAERFPWANMHEFTATALAIAVGAYLVLNLKLHVRWLGLFIALLASIALGLAVTVFYVDVSPLVPSLHSVWFMFHISAAMLSSAAFTIGGIASIMYLVRSRAEKRGEVRGYLAKMPSSQAIDTFAYRCAAFGFPMFTFVIAAGAIWAQYAWGRYWGWDPKETWSLITWAIYAAYLHARSTAGWKGARAAIISIIGMAVFWWNFVGINLFVQGLHSYAK